ncbi:hypothetical protein HAX54_019958, partial [Datura stramonium]|nr:hypothetical protein [Datura stramonium]
MEKATYLNEIKVATKWSFYSRSVFGSRKKPLCLKMLGWLDWMAALSGTEECEKRIGHQPRQYRKD